MDHEKAAAIMVSSELFIRMAPVPLGLLDSPHDPVRAASEAFAAALDTTPEALRQRPFAQLFADPEEVARRVQAVLDGHEPVSAAPLTNAAGNSLFLTAWALDGAEPGVGVLLTADDTGDGEERRDGPLTDTLREVNEALLVSALEEHADAEEARSESEAKSVFLASVSHELRTPLNSILGYSDLLEAGVPEALPEALESHVARIRTAAQHLLSLIEQIIEASRAEFDDRIDPEPLDMAAFVPDVVDLVRRRVEDAGLELRIERSTESLDVVADRRKVRQVLLNLLVNAVKFTDEGSITVTLDHTEESYTLQVRDTGIGMSEEDKANVFRRFWQAGGSPVRTDGGMGIGLWVVRTLVDAMGGSIQLDSAPGQGSTFTVTLPRRPEVARALDEGDGAGGEEEGEGRAGAPARRSAPSPSRRSVAR